jgi:hypothetical protein
VQALNDALLAVGMNHEKLLAEELERHGDGRSVEQYCAQICGGAPASDVLHPREPLTLLQRIARLYVIYLKGFWNYRASQIFGHQFRQTNALPAIGTARAPPPAACQLVPRGLSARLTNRSPIARHSAADDSLLHLRQYRLARVNGGRPRALRQTGARKPMIGTSHNTERRHWPRASLSMPTTRVGRSCITAWRSRNELSALRLSRPRLAKDRPKASGRSRANERNQVADFRPPSRFRGSRLTGGRQEAGSRGNNPASPSC